MAIVRSMVLVSDDPLSRERNAGAVRERFVEEIRRRGLEGEVAVHTISGIHCKTVAPLAIVYPEAAVYGPLRVEDVPLVVEEHLVRRRPIPALMPPPHKLSGRLAWLGTRKGALPAEQRIVLRRVGRIDPESIEEYMQHGGYAALRQALTTMTPREIIETVYKAGLQGRGGAGFPTGVKWRFVAAARGERKYVVCNADESEPGTFKDRVIMEGDPHSVLEGISIAAYAVGAREGYIYVRGEYPLAQRRLRTAIRQAQERGLLGENILGSDFSFTLQVHSGAGAYICGEETALLESLEGRRGEPRSRPPYPTTRGLWGQPTLVNNVETLANVPPILQNGWEWYRQFGTPSSPGTKVYTILGNVAHTGIIEAPMGITLREVIAIYGGGMKDGKRFKLAQTGGSSGSIVPASLQDTPMDFDSYRKAGVSLGSGALLICNEETCVVDLACALLDFFRRESCGKCTPCRVGTQRAWRLLARLARGQGSPDDLQELRYVADTMAQLSHCGLGHTAAVPLKGILEHYRAEVEAHARLKVCPAGICPMQTRFHGWVQANVVEGGS